MLSSDCVLELREVVFEYVEGGFGAMSSSTGTTVGGVGEGEAGFTGAAS